MLTGEAGSSNGLARRTARYLDREHLPWGERILELWFAPKPFESTALYEHLGVKLLKRYVPTGGDYFIHRFGVRVIDVRPDLEAMIRFEERTRLYEVLHTFFFLAFTTFSLWRWLTRRTTFLDFLFAVLVYVLLILSPVALQRYNRIRIYRAIHLLARKQGILPLTQ